MSNSPIESFKTHSNYIRAFALLVYDPTLLRRNQMYATISQRIHGAKIIPNARRDDLDLNQIQRSLHTAWGTETLLQASNRFANEEEILRLSNNWSAVQVYYVFYHSAQALHCAHGHPRPESHPRTQNVFFDQWANRRLMLAPWSFAYGSQGVINVPDGHVADETIHSWSNCEGDNVFSLAAKSLMTTRRDALHECRKRLRDRKLQQRRRAWRAVEEVRHAEGRRPRKEPDFPLPQLTDEEITASDHDMRPYTIMDYLYRLRLKTNYEDSNMFTDGPENEIDSRSVRNALCRIAGGTLLLYEIMIRALIGSRLFDEWVQAWVAHNVPDAHESGLATRIEYHRV